MIDLLLVAAEAATQVPSGGRDPRMPLGANANGGTFQ